MNGPVFVAAVIEREGWTSEISFVGHENTIQVTAFNPRLFFSEGVPQDRIHASCMLALGADDFSISVWRNTHHKPIVVVRDVFARQLLDLCWANDGLTLYGCSADGTVCAMQFRPDEFPELAAADMTDKILEDYKYNPPHRRKAPQKPLSVTTSFTAAPAGAQEHVNVIIPRKAPKKAPRRIGLSGMMGGAAAATNGSASASGGRAPLARPALTPQRGTAADAFAFAADQPLSDSPVAAATARMFERGAFDRDSALKRKASEDDFGRGAPKGRTMGRESRNLGPVQEIRAPRVAISASTGSGHLLPVPSIQSVLRVQQDEGQGVFTAENSTDGGNTTIALAVNGKESWVDFIPSPALAIVANTCMCAVASEDGMIRVFSPAGRHISSFKLPYPASELAAGREFLMVVTVDCMVRVIDTRKGSVPIPPSSIAHLFDPPSSSAKVAPVADLKAIMVRPNGCPVVITSEPAAWAYDQDVAAWTQIATPWWGTSPLSESRTRGRSSQASGPLAEIEQRIASAADVDQPDKKPQWWDEAMSMGHYETRLRAARLLDSKDEYKHWLREYSKYLAQEDFRERAEELISDLMGPLYQ